MDSDKLIRMNGTPDWVRGEITTVIKELNLSEDDIHEVGKHDWNGILEKIEHAFFDHAQGLRQGLHSPKFKSANIFLMKFPNYDAYKHLDSIIINDGRVWFMAQETSRQTTKYWLYAGTVVAIQRVLGEVSRFEYCVVSKKLEWLLFENHHGFLIGVGEQVVSQMMTLKRTIDKS